MFSWFHRGEIDDHDKCHVENCLVSFAESDGSKESEDKDDNSDSMKLRKDGKYDGF